MLLLLHLLPVMQSRLFLNFMFFKEKEKKTQEKKKDAAKLRGQVKISIFQTVLTVFLSFKPAQVLLRE